MRVLHWSVGSLFVFCTSSQILGQALSPEQWQQDLDQLSTAVQEIHFKPFHVVSEGEFQAAVDSLHQLIPDITDEAIILEMARIISLLKDGHSRLHIPRLYPELALEAELGHSGTPPPMFESLKFFQSPLRFQLFDDGVFVIAATEQFRHLVGQSVSKIDETGIDIAIEAVKSVSFYENESRTKLMAPDRLALPQVLHFLHVIANPLSFTVTTEDANGRVHETQLESLTSANETFFYERPAPLPLWTKNLDENKWFETLPNQDAIYVQVNEFEESPPVPYSDFVAETLASARDEDVSRYIVDLRHNSGGIGAWVTPFVTGLADSEYNEYGRLYILMGRTTFSAAQTFLHRFEELTYALFAGEPSGAKPSHFGDSRRIVLNNSGLTLRLSTIYWHSWLANDFRDSINPHISAAYEARHYFAGEDPVLEAALNYPGNKSLANQMDEQFRQGKNQNALLLYNRYMTDGRFRNHHTVIPDLLEMADGLIADGYTRPGYFVYVLVNQSYPGDTEIEAELARIESNL